MHQDRNLLGCNKKATHQNPTFKLSALIDSYNLKSAPKIKTPKADSLAIIKDFNAIHRFTNMDLVNHPYKDNYNGISKIENSSIKLNYDANPIVISKKLKRPISYEQKVAIRFLRPSSPPPVG
jgi:hypothetical protein